MFTVGGTSSHILPDELVITTLSNLFYISHTLFFSLSVITIMSDQTVTFFLEISLSFHYESVLYYPCLYVISTCVKTQRARPRSYAFSGPFRHALLVGRLEGWTESAEQCYHTIYWNESRYAQR